MYCIMIKGNESLVVNFNFFYFLTQLSHNWISGYRVMKNLSVLKNIKQRNLNTDCQYLKNNMADIRLMPLDHVTYQSTTTFITSASWFIWSLLHPHPTHPLHWPPSNIFLVNKWVIFIFNCQFLVSTPPPSTWYMYYPISKWCFWLLYFWVISKTCWYPLD